MGFGGESFVGLSMGWGAAGWGERDGGEGRGLWGVGRSTREGRGKGQRQSKKKYANEALHPRGTVGTILGAWLGAIPIPLDW